MGEVWAARIVAGTRLPVAAGLYYEADAELLRAQIEWAFGYPLDSSASSRAGSVGVVGIIVPHAGLFYSGPVAARAYMVLRSLERKPGTVVVVGPNHTGVGAPVSVYPEGQWRTPLGSIVVDSVFSRRLAGAASLDYSGHVYEHSVEVQLPFIQFVYGDSPPRLVAVSMADQRLSVAMRLGDAVYEAARAVGDGVFLVATTNMTQFMPASSVRERDRVLLEAITSGDPEAVYSALEASGGSMCGVAPVAVALRYLQRVAEEKGCTPSVELLGYATSADVGGDDGYAVGYASLALYCT